MGIRIKISSNVVNTFLEDNISVADRVSMVGSSCGRFTYIGNDSDVSYTKIGRFCSISHHVSVCRGNHPVNYVTTFPAFYYDTSKQIGFTIHHGKPIYDNIYKYPQGESKFQVIIGNDVWIGAHVLILGGVTIGDGAVIGAGSVVTKDVKPYSIVGGNPAKEIRKRFDDNTINKLIALKWWNYSVRVIVDNYRNYADINRFIDKNS